MNCVTQPTRLLQQLSIDPDLYRRVQLRLDEATEEQDGCMLWRGTCSAGGANPVMMVRYSKLFTSQVAVSVARLVWTIHTGGVPAQTVRRSCPNKKCVSPAHLYVGDISPQKRYAQKWKKIVEKTDVLASGCWVWTGVKDRWGYGTTSFFGKSTRVHRIAYVIHKGEIEPGLVICHTCDKPACVNPEHLFKGTHRDNVYDAIAKGRHSTVGLRNQRS